MTSGPIKTWIRLPPKTLWIFLNTIKFIDGSAPMYTGACIPECVHLSMYTGTCTGACTLECVHLSFYNIVCTLEHVHQSVYTWLHEHVHSSLYTRIMYPRACRLGHVHQSMYTIMYPGSCRLRHVHRSIYTRACTPECVHGACTLECINRSFDLGTH